jgi:hypothetical protein
MSQVATTGYIGVMVEPGDENLVAGGKPSRKRARKVEGERGHILTKDNFFGAGSVQKVRHRRVGGFQDSVRFAAGFKRAFMVGVTFQKITLDTFHALAGNLCATGCIEKDGRAFKRGELPSNGLQVECHSQPLLIQN